MSNGICSNVKRNLFKCETEIHKFFKTENTWVYVHLWHCENFQMRLESQTIVKEMGPDLKEVNFNEILDIFKEKNRRIRL